MPLNRLPREQECVAVNDINFPSDIPMVGRRLVSPKMTAAVTVAPLTNLSTWNQAQTQTGREINDNVDGQVQSARDGRTNTDISGETSEGPCHRNADRTSCGRWSRAVLHSRGKLKCCED